MPARAVNQRHGMAMWALGACYEPKPSYRSSFETAFHTSYLSERGKEGEGGRERDRGGGRVKEGEKKRKLPE